MPLGISTTNLNGKIGLKKGDFESSL